MPKTFDMEDLVFRVLSRLGTGLTEPPKGGFQKHSMERRLYQVEFILNHPKMNERELAILALSSKAYSPKTGTGLIRFSIARIRRIKELIDAGKIKSQPDPAAEIISQVSKWEYSRPTISPAIISQKKAQALRAASAFLRACGWKKVKLSQRNELSFWKDPLTPSSHRLDVAFLIACTRDSEIARRST